jgi:glycosyltransferase involved in cell wall biosynthesis
MMPPVPTITLHPSGEKVLDEMAGVKPRSVRGPLVSCLMVTRGDRPAVTEAILGYQQQTYRNRELVIVTSATDNLVEPLLSELGDPSIHFHLTSPAILGELRNVSVGRASGELLCLWDDDDLYHPMRIESQVAALMEADAAASFLSRWVLWQIATRRIAISHHRLWEGSMLARRDAMSLYRPIGLREDTALVKAVRSRGRVVAIDMPGLYCYIGDGANSWNPGHFERLLAMASQHFDGDQYEKVLASLSRDMPIAARLQRHQQG